MTITTPLGHTYNRIAWTGGKVPDIDWHREPLHNDLIQAFYDDQVKDSGGLDLWECAGTSANERKEIFMRRALFDAFATMGKN